MHGSNGSCAAGNCSVFIWLNRLFRGNCMKKTKKRKINFCRFPENNLRKMRGMAMKRHAGKKHIEKWRDSNMPF